MRTVSEPAKANMKLFKRLVMIMHFAFMTVSTEI
ncbi:hypothetical protein KYE_07407 [Marinobacter manganoxydans MnI7-9]|uniref:Uncharacterized protein n=1 Tax=Marinobacter manganoxydans MnI7-9 TaxID=1094979 RepID=G6YRK4_9GAMM|nr:hypothetical protein KYE_07407 [Marinobacter manganoxydans MnI7-9]